MLLGLKMDIPLQISGIGLHSIFFDTQVAIWIAVDKVVVFGNLQPCIL